jgi:PAS domain S-box-containing protein
MAYGALSVKLVFVTAAYFAAGKLGLSLAYVNESASAVWPPAGIAVAALLVLGPRAAVAVFAGALLTNVTTSGSAVASIAIAGGNTLEAVAAAWLVNRFAGGVAAFTRTPDILRFTALAAGAATTIAATVGTATLLATGLASWDTAGSIWLTWWLGDAVGTLVIAPLLVLRPPAWRSPLLSTRSLEALALTLAAVATAVAVFGITPVGALRLPMEFLALPVLLWAAFRFGTWATAAASATLAAFAISGTLAGYGPFARPDPNTALLLLQAFIGVVTVVMLSVAAEVAARRAAEHDLRAFNHDLERRVEARTEEVRRVHARLTEAQQVAHVGSWEWDLADNSLWWSEEMCRIFGVENAPASYETYTALIHPFDRERSHAAVHRATVDGHPFAFDHRIVRPSGEVRTLYAEGRVVLGQDGRPLRMMGIGHDITDRVAAEAQRSQLLVEQAGRRDAERASRAKDQFLATLSHELRTPLNVALGWAQLLRTLTLPPERTGAAVETIQRNLQLLSQLVSDITDASRITVGAFKLEAETVDLRAVAAAAVETVRDAADVKRIVIAVSEPPAALFVRGDARRLQQVVWNLLTNAVKFGRPGGCVTLTLAGGIADATIEVADDGPGIPAEFLPHVFEEFRQADPSQTREHGGLGLGLSIARHLAELHGGSITAANRMEGGAVFVVRLPVGVTATA